ncbi:MAG: hypothetical protein LBL92_03000 [Propionibacteriaceae bacterium]|jgi:hypothetical protein|nr:hypothetical protein [Propionibacteriaceae bacterium]
MKRTAFAAVLSLFLIATPVATAVGSPEENSALRASGEIRAVSDQTVVSLADDVQVCDPRASGLVIQSNIYELDLQIEDHYTLSVTFRSASSGYCDSPISVKFYSESDAVEFSSDGCELSSRGACTTNVTAAKPGTYSLHATMLDQATGQYVELGGESTTPAYPNLKESPVSLTWVPQCSGQPEVAISPSGPISVGQSYQVSVTDYSICLWDMMLAAEARKVGFTAEPDNPTLVGQPYSTLAGQPVMESCRDVGPDKVSCTADIRSDTAGVFQVNAYHADSAGLPVYLLKTPVTLEWVDTQSPTFISFIRQFLLNFIQQLLAILFGL